MRLEKSCCILLQVQNYSKQEDMIFLMQKCSLNYNMLYKSKARKGGADRGYPGGRRAGAEEGAPLRQPPLAGAAGGDGLPHEVPGLRP